MREVDRFMDLFKSKYSDVASCPTLTPLKDRHYNAPEELPSTEDLLKLKTYTDEQLESLADHLKHGLQGEVTEWVFFQIQSEI